MELANRLLLLASTTGVTRKDLEALLCSACECDNFVIDSSEASQIYVIRKDYLISVLVELFAKLDSKNRKFVIKALQYLLRCAQRNLAVCSELPRYSAVHETVTMKKKASASKAGTDSGRSASGEVDSSIPHTIESRLRYSEAGVTSLIELCCDLMVLPGLDNREFDGLLSLVSTLGEFSFPVGAVKRYFEVFWTPSTLSATQYRQLLETLRAVKSHQAEPSALPPLSYFDFDGQCGGLRLPLLPRVPWHYSFELWFRAECFNGDVPFNPLLTLVDRKGERIEIGFERDVLIVNCAERSAVKYPFEPRMWYHLIVVSKAGKVRGSTVIVHVNGREVFKCAARYKTFHRMPTGFVGASDRTELPCFFGQIALFRMYHDAVSEPHASVLFSQRTHPWCTDMPTRNVGALSGGARSAVPAAWISYHPGACEKGVVHCHSADAVYPAVLVPGTRLVVTRRLLSSLHCNGGVKILLPMFKLLDLRHAGADGECIVKWLRPLDKHARVAGSGGLNLAERSRGATTAAAAEPRDNDAKNPASSRQAPPLGTVTDAAASGLLDPRFMAWLLAFLKDLLEDQLRMEPLHVVESLQRVSFFSVLGLLVSRAAPSQMNEEIVSLLQSIADTSAASTNDAIRRDSYVALVANFSMWKNCTTDMQRHFISNYVHLSQTRPALMRTLHSIQDVLNGLRFHYAYRGSDKLREDLRHGSTSSSGEEGEEERRFSVPLASPRCTNRIADRDTEMQQLRLLLLRSISPSKTMDEVTVDTWRPLFRFLSECEDELQLADVLHFLCTLLCASREQLLAASADSAPPVSQFARRLAAVASPKLHGSWSFVQLALTAKSESVRLLAIRVTYLLHVALPESVQDALEAEYGPHLAFCTEMLRRERFTRATYDTLAELIVGRVQPMIPCCDLGQARGESDGAEKKAAANLSKESSESKTPVDVAAARGGFRLQPYSAVQRSLFEMFSVPSSSPDGGGFQVRHAALIGVTLQSMRGEVDMDALCSALTDICRAVQCNDDFAGELVEQLAWQNWIIDIYLDHHGTPAMSLALELMNALLLFGMHQPSGWMIIEDTQTFFLGHIDSHPELTGVIRDMERTLYSNLFAQLRDDLSKSVPLLEQINDRSLALSSGSASRRSSSGFRRITPRSSFARRADSKSTSAEDSALGLALAEARANPGVASSEEEGGGDDDDNVSESEVSTPIVLWYNVINVIALFEELVFYPSAEPVFVADSDSNVNLWRDFDIVSGLLSAIDPILHLDGSVSLPSVADLQSAAGKNVFVILLRFATCLLQYSPSNLAAVRGTSGAPLSKADKFKHAARQARQAVKNKTSRSNTGASNSGSGNVSGVAAATAAATAEPVVASPASSSSSLTLPQAGSSSGSSALNLLLLKSPRSGSERKQSTAESIKKRGNSFIKGLKAKAKRDKTGSGAGSGDKDSSRQEVADLGASSSSSNVLPDVSGTSNSSALSASDANSSGGGVLSGNALMRALGARSTSSRRDAAQLLASNSSGIVAVDNADLEAEQLKEQINVQVARRLKKEKTIIIGDQAQLSSFMEQQVMRVKLLFARTSSDESIVLWTLAHVLQTMQTLYEAEGTQYRLLVSLVRELVARMPGESRAAWMEHPSMSRGAAAEDLISFTCEGRSRERKLMFEQAEKARRAMQLAVRSAMQSAVAQRRKSNQEQLHTLLSGHEADMDRQLASVAQRAREARRDLGESAVWQLRTAMLAQEQWAHGMERHWQKIAFDRSLWSRFLQSDFERRAYWKIDKREDNERMRLRLRVNVDGGDHVEATVAYRKAHPEAVAVAAAAAAEARNAGEELDDDDEEEEEERLRHTQSSRRRASGGGGKSDESGASATGSSQQQQKGTRLPDSIDEYVVFDTPCFMVDPMSANPGRLVITGKCLYFIRRRRSKKRQLDEAAAAAREGDLSSMVLKHSYRKPDYMKRDKKWPLEIIVGIEKRRYMLRHNALELFFEDRKNRLFTFPPRNVRTQFLTALMKVRPANLSVDLHTFWQKPLELLKQDSSITRRWQRREISTFEYLMALNTLSGRTYNDMTQYPVFPWVIKDYSSSTLDLSDPDVYRDLSRPIGALNEERLADFIERYESFEDPDIPKFHYGSHYSSAGSVLYYHLRLEPFTTYSLVLQGGKFDHADRLFHRVAATWQNVLSSPSDVKEITPEFYYQAEIFCNSQEFDLGIKQNHEFVTDVALPAWADNSPHRFVQLQREALESEYVSARIHHWIDLIFGYKQRGRAAVEAHNVFYYLTYEDAVDMDKIDDPITRKAMEVQIANFGQCPAQLFDKPHPSREPVTKAQRRATANLVTEFARERWHVPTPQPLSAPSDIFIVEGLIAISDIGGRVTGFAWNPDGEMVAQLLKADAGTTSSGTSAADAESLGTAVSGASAATRTASAGAATITPTVTLPFVLDTTKAAVEFNQVAPSHRMLPPFRVLPGGGTRPPVLIGTTLDESLSMAHPGSAQVLKEVCCHFGRITTLAVSEDGRYLVSGSNDGTCALWDLQDVGRARRNTRRSNTPKTVISSSLGLSADSSISDPQSGSASDLLLGNSAAGESASATIESPLQDSGQHAPQSGAALGAADILAAALGQMRMPSRPQATNLGSSPLHILRGHDSFVTKVAVNADQDVVASGAKDGSVILHSLRGGNYLRTVWHPRGCPVELLSLGRKGEVVMYSSFDDCLHVFDVNGRILASAKASDDAGEHNANDDNERWMNACKSSISNSPPLSQARQARVGALCITRDGKHILTGGTVVRLWQLETLKCVHQYASAPRSGSRSVTSLAVSADSRFVFVGFESGSQGSAIDDKGDLGDDENAVQSAALIAAANSSQSPVFYVLYLGDEVLSSSARNKKKRNSVAIVKEASFGTNSSESVAVNVSPKKAKEGKPRKGGKKKAKAVRKSK